MSVLNTCARISSRVKARNMEQQIVEVIGHEILEGDIKKAYAESNDASTGGGARDLRFPKKYKPQLDRLFSAGAHEYGRTEYMVCDFDAVLSDGSKTLVSGLKYALNPTAARPGEVRIAQISAHDFFKQMPHVADGDGALFVVFVRMSSGNPRMMFATQKQLNDPESDEVIAAAMRDSISSKRAGSAAIFTVRFE